MADLTEDMAIMVAKGFLISDCVKFKVYCLPYRSKRSQMPAHSFLQTQKITRLREHVEHVIRRVKGKKPFDEYRFPLIPQRQNRDILNTTKRKLQVSKNVFSFSCSEWFLRCKTMIFIATNCCFLCIS